VGCKRTRVDKKGGTEDRTGSRFGGRGAEEQRGKDNEVGRGRVPVGRFGSEASWKRYRREMLPTLLVLFLTPAHVGRAVRAWPLSELPFSVRWIDSRRMNSPDFCASHVITVRNPTRPTELDGAAPAPCAVRRARPIPIPPRLIHHQRRRCAAWIWVFVGLIGIGHQSGRASPQPGREKLGISEIPRICTAGPADRNCLRIRDKEPIIIAAGVQPNS